MPVASISDRHIRYMLYAAGGMLAVSAAFSITGLLLLESIDDAGAHEHQYKYVLVTSGGTEIPILIPFQWAGGQFGMEGYQGQERATVNDDNDPESRALSALMAAFSLNARIVGYTPEDTHIVFDRGGAQDIRPLKPYMVIPPGTDRAATHSVISGYDPSDAADAHAVQPVYFDNNLLTSAQIQDIPRATGGIYVYDPVSGFSRATGAVISGGNAAHMVIPTVPAWPHPMEVMARNYAQQPCPDDGTSRLVEYPGTTDLLDETKCMLFELEHGKTRGTIIISTGAPGMSGSGVDHQILITDGSGGDAIEAACEAASGKMPHLTSNNWHGLGTECSISWEVANRLLNMGAHHGTAFYSEKQTVVVHVFSTYNKYAELRFYEDDWQSAGGGSCGAGNGKPRDFWVYDQSDDLQLLAGKGDSESLESIWVNNRDIRVVASADPPDRCPGGGIIPVSQSSGQQLYNPADTIVIHGGVGGWMDVSGRQDFILDRVNEKRVSGNFFPDSVMYDVRSYLRVPVGMDARLAADLYRNDTQPGDAVSTYTRTSYLGWDDYSEGDYLHVPVIAGYHGAILRAQPEGGGISRELLLLFENLVGSDSVHVATNMTAKRGHIQSAPVIHGEIEAAVSAGSVATHSGTMKAVFTIVSDGDLKLTNTFLTVRSDCGIMRQPLRYDPMSAMVDIYRNGVHVKAVQAGVVDKPVINDTSSPPLNGNTQFPITSVADLEQERIGTNLVYNKAWYATQFNYTDSTFFGSASVPVEPGDYVDFVITVRIHGEFNFEGGAPLNPFAACTPATSTLDVGEYVGRIHIRSAIIETSS